MLYDTETLRQILHGAGCTEQDVKKQRCACMQQLHEQQRQVDRLDRLIREQAAI